MLQRFNVGQTIDWQYKSFQEKQMDPDLNGEIDGVDISFILYALAKKYRFLDALPVPKAEGCEKRYSKNHGREGCPAKGEERTPPPAGGIKEEHRSAQG